MGVCTLEALLVQLAMPVMPVAAMGALLEAQKMAELQAELLAVAQAVLVWKWLQKPW